ncbi:hypothetical protein Tco_0517739 [Tanacetum coccineum]
MDMAYRTTSIRRIRYIGYGVPDLLGMAYRTYWELRIGLLWYGVLGSWVRRIGSLGTVFCTSWVHRIELLQYEVLAESVFYLIFDQSIIYDVYIDVDTAYSSKSCNDLLIRQRFCDKHNMVAFLQKPTGSEEFHHIVYFLAGSHIRYALTVNPTIYVSLIEQFWQTATVNTVNDGEQQITITVDGQTIAITKASVRRHLQLADADGISSLPNTEIFEQLTLMGYVSNNDKLIIKKVNFHPN